MLKGIIEGNIGSFLGALGRNILMDEGQEGLERLLNRIDWKEMAKNANPAIKKLLAGALRNANDAQLGRGIRLVIAGLRAGIEKSKLDPKKSRIISEALDSISDEINDAIDAGHMQEVRQALGMSTTNPTSTETDKKGTTVTTTSPPKAEVKIPPKLEDKQRRAFVLLSAMLDANIWSDTLDVPRRPRAFSTDLHEMLVKYPDLCNHLPDDQEDQWYKNGMQRIARIQQYRQELQVQLSHTHARRYTHLHPTQLETLRQERQQYIETAQGELQTMYHEYGPFITMVRSAREQKDSGTGDTFETGFAQFGDLIDRLTDPDDRERMRERIGAFGRSVLDNGTNGLAVYLLLAITLPIMAIFSTISGFLGAIGFFIQSPLTQFMGTIVALVIGLCFVGITGWMYMFALHQRPVGHWSIAFGVPLALWFMLFIVPFSFMMTLGNGSLSLASSLTGAGIALLWTMFILSPLKEISETLSGFVRDGKENALVTIAHKILKIISFGKFELIKTGTTTSSPVREEKDIGFIVNIGTVVTIVSGYASWVAGSIYWFVLFGTDLRTAIAAAGLGGLGTISAGIEISRRNTKTEQLSLAKLKSDDISRTDKKRYWMVKTGEMLIFLWLAQVLGTVVYMLIGVQAGHTLVNMLAMGWPFTPIIGFLVFCIGLWSMMWKNKNTVLTTILFALGLTIFFGSFVIHGKIREQETLIEMKEKLSP